ncbi:MAG: ribonuclease P protein component [Candidatus Margulisiibacteriota bacterium]
MMSLTRDRDFKKVYAQGRTVSNRHFKVKYIFNGLGLMRVAVVVPGRIATAVIRNRIRRRIIGAIRKLNIDYFAIDVVIFPNLTAKNASFDSIFMSLKKIFEMA